MNFYECTGLTGMSEGPLPEHYFKLNRFGGQPHTLPHSSPFPSPLSSFLLPHRAILLLAGDLSQWHLPVGMKDINLRETKVTGKAQLIKRVAV